MGFFDSKSTTETDINQSDNKVNNEVSDSAETLTLSGTSNHILGEGSKKIVFGTESFGNSLTIEEFDHEFATQTMRDSLLANNANNEKAFDLVEKTFNSAIDGAKETVTALNNIASNASRTNNDLVTANGTGPDARLENITKIVLIASLGLGGLALMKKAK